MLGPQPLQDVLKRASAQKDQLDEIYLVPVLLLAAERQGTLLGSDADDEEDSKVRTLPATDLAGLRAQAAGAGRPGAGASFDAPGTLVVPVQRRLAKSKEPKISFGRASICDVVLNHTAISKHHGSLEQREGVWHVFDVGSTNGIVVDGKKVSREGALLRDGSVIELGTAQLRFLSARAFVEFLRLKLG